MSVSFERALLRTTRQRVPRAWIDYNGHMNVAYYTMAFDRALDEVYETLGIGEGLVQSANMGPMALQTQLHYLGELLEGTEFAVDFLLVDHDAKRVHSMSSMIAFDAVGGSERVAATYETISLNVDLAARRSAPYPEDPARRIAALATAQAELPRPEQLGKTIGIRRRSG